MKESIFKFTCICGKSFKSQQSLKAHKSHCELCLTPEQLKRRKELYTEVGKRSSQYAKDTKIKKAEQWKKEGHICEQCGKLMEVKFGSGRFCSRTCSNKWVSLHQSEEAIKRKVEKGIGNLKRVKKTKNKNVSNSNKENVILSHHESADYVVRLSQGIINRVYAIFICFMIKSKNGYQQV